MEPLSPVARQFILHWGEMSSRWGINRSMAQIHALLYLSTEPLNAEKISETLTLARSNVSTSLRELQAWGIVKVVHLLGDRRDFFETMKDPWKMLLTILEQRRRREIDPTIAMLRECIDEAEISGAQEEHHRERMLELLELLESLTEWYEQVGRLSPSIQKKMIKMGGKIHKFAKQVRQIALRGNREKLDGRHRHRTRAPTRAGGHEHGRGGGVGNEAGPLRGDRDCDRDRDGARRGP